MKKIYFGISVIAAAVLVMLILVTEVPLGITGQWVWQRIPAFQLQNQLFAVVTPLAVIAAVFFAVSFAISRFADNPRRVRLAGILIVLIGSFCFQEAILESGRAGRGENELAVLDKFTGGYVTEAANITRPGEYFRKYAEKLKQGGDRANHLNVHPPGNVFCGYLLLKFCEYTPFPRWYADWRSGLNDRHDTFSGTLFTTDAQKEKEELLYQAAAFTVFLNELALACAALLTLFAAIRLYGHTPSPGSFLRAAAAAVVLSGTAALFMGHCDSFYYFLGALIFYLLVCSARQTAGPVKAILCTLTGILTAFACSCSMSFGALIPFAAILFLCRKNWRSGIVPLVLFCTGGILLTAILWAYADVCLPECAFYAAKNNSVFLAGNRTTPWRWIPYDFLDCVLFASPLTVLAAAYGFLTGKDRFLSTRANVFRLAALLIIVLICANPFQISEMGRLLQYLFPALLILVLYRVFRDGDKLPIPAFTAAVFAQGVLFTILRVYLKLVIVWG